MSEEKKEEIKNMCSALGGELEEIGKEDFNCDFPEDLDKSTKKELQKSFWEGVEGLKG